MTFIENLKASWDKKNSLVCVGLDTDVEKIPEHLKTHEKPVFEFNKAIIDATADFSSVFKFQYAMYAGSDAIDQLQESIAYAKQNYPDVPLILDAKRNDIGNTASMYAKQAFEILGADAITVNPYMGGDTIEPFSDNPDKAEKLCGDLKRADYIIVSSPRARATIGRLPEHYPIMIRYYHLLDEGGLGFEMGKECTSYPHLFGWEIKDSSAEESFWVYDHPPVRIYKKIQALSRDDCRGLLVN